MRLILPLHVRRLVVLVGFALMLPLVVATPASADPVADKKAEAARIANDLEAEGARVSLAAEQFNQARLKVAEVQSSLTKVRGDLARADERMQAAKSLLAEVAVQSYVTGGSTSFFSHIAKSEKGDLVLRTQYLRFTAADQRAVMGQVRAAREDFSAAQERLSEEERVSASAAAAAEAAKQQADAAEAAQRNLLGRVNGELTELVAAETNARLAAQAAAAPAVLNNAAASVALNGGPAPTLQTQLGARNAPAPAAEEATPSQLASVPAPPASGGAGTAVAAAEAEVGKPYVYGASGPDSYDCSGLMMWAWGKAGVSLSHSAQAQYSETTRVPVSDMQPGDLIFFGSSTSSIGHNAMYVGGGSMVEAPRTGLNVRIVGVRDGIVGVGRPG